jgi:hypothetical protein
MIFKTIFINYFGPVIIFFSYYHNFIIHHYQMTFKFEISILEQKMKMDINNFEFIYFLIMDGFHPIIYL